MMIAIPFTPPHTIFAFNINKLNRIADSKSDKNIVRYLLTSLFVFIFIIPLQILRKHLLLQKMHLDLFHVYLLLVYNNL